jgi:general secretion pathway protein J
MTYFNPKCVPLIYKTIQLTKLHIPQKKLIPKSLLTPKSSQRYFGFGKLGNFKKISLPNTSSKNLISLLRNKISDVLLIFEKENLFLGYPLKRSINIVYVKVISRNENTRNRCLSLSKAVIVIAFDKLRLRYNFFWKSPKIACYWPKKIQGFTLIELLVALTIFSIMAMMAYGGLNTIISARLQIEQQASQLTHLQRTLSWLKHDFEQFVNRPIRDQYGDKQLSLQGTNTQVEFTRAGWRNPAQQPRSSLQRVAYHLENKTLVRSYWWVLDRAQDAHPIQMNLLIDVTDLQFRYLDKNLQWTEQWPSFDRSLSEKTNQALPIIKAIEVTLTVSGWGQLIRLFRING